MLLNLLSNAVKFSDHGEISLRVSQLAIQDSSALLHFEVCDQGIGMEQSTVANLFQDFSQADASTTRKYGGTGLGLAISQQVVRLMGGRIAVQSHPQKGSCFYFDLNLTVVRPEQHLPLGDLQSGFPPSLKLSGKVLIVEDNLANQKAAIEMVQELGCNVKLASSGTQALALLQQEEFDLVLIDGQMPEMDGFQATERIRQGEGGASNAQIPILASTANTAEGETERCLAAGMNDYVGKPISFEDLAFKMEKWLRYGKRRIEPRALANLRKFARPGQANLLSELIDLYGDESPKTLRHMREKLAVRDYQGVSFLAHGLRSSSATLGAMRMKELSERIERLKPDVKLHLAESLITTLESELKWTLKELHQVQISPPP